MSELTPTHQLFDLQVNGFGGVDFNADAVSDEQLVSACGRLREHGVAGILATVITDELPRMERRIARLAEACSALPQVAETIRGIHVEGPFISSTPGYVGAHPAQAVRPAEIGACQRLVEAGAGLVRLVTLAPEQDAKAATTRWLVDRGVRVAAGHTNASLDELRTAIDAGLTLFTHLGNGCPLAMPRHDNIVQRALSLRERMTCCFIADGVHVPLFALQNYLALAGPERAIVVSDAISAAGLGPGTYGLAGRQVVVDEQLATWSDDRAHLVGSALPLSGAVENLRRRMGVSAEEVRRMTWDNPRRALGLTAPA